MTPIPTEYLQVQRVLDIVAALLRTDSVAVIGRLVALVGSLYNRPGGIYEVLEYDAELELCDPKGKQAVFSKRQRVRFLQDNVIAYQDQAFGDGDIFAEYMCTPGIPVDRYQEGYRYRILISLRQTKNRGDVEEFHIERHIKDGFREAEGYFQTNIDHKTDKLILRLLFPAARKPSELSLVEQNRTRTTPLGTEHIRPLPNGNWLIQWEREKPRQFESYILRWKW